MKSASPVGIYGIGVGIPDQVRKNSDWPEEFSRKFWERKKRDASTAESVVKKGSTSPQEAALRRMFAMEDDPFRGSVERRILPRPAKSSVLEIAAAQEAIQTSGVDRHEIDLVLCYSMPSDYVAPNNGAIIAKHLELPNAIAIGTEAGCPSFIVQMQLAAAMISAGAARHALVVSSILLSRILDYTSPISVNCGDGAAAAVLGPVSAGHGILGYFGKNDNVCHEAAITAPYSLESWLDSNDPIYIHTPDLDVARHVVVASGDYCRTAVNTALERAGLKASDVSCFFAHQPSIWFNEVCRSAAGLQHARTKDTFKEFASVGPANIPTNLYFGLKEGLVHDDDVVAMYSCGQGFNFAAMVLRWGR